MGDSYFENRLRFWARDGILGTKCRSDDVFHISTGHFGCSGGKTMTQKKKAVDKPYPSLPEVKRIRMTDQELFEALNENFGGMARGI